MAAVDLSVEIAGKTLRNPTVLASGVLGVGGHILTRVARAGAGAVTTKSCGLSSREGHPNPTVLDWGHGLINAVGLSNPGVREEIDELQQVLPELRNMGVPLLASIFADSVDNFGVLAEIMAEAEPDFLELNISCPNVDDIYKEPFCFSPRAAAAVVDQVKKRCSLPVIVKLSPNAHNLAEVARAVEWAGADAITAVNTLGPGMVINVELGMPILANVAGGISGPALRPIAVRCVYEIYRAVKIPIIGTGGVSEARDALEMIMAGATAVGVGSAVYYKGIQVFAEIVEGIGSFMLSHNVGNLRELQGIAHRGGLRASKVG